VVGALGAWELLSRTELIPSRPFPAFSQTLFALLTEATGGALWLALAQTLEGWGIGLAIAAALAIPAGILIGSSRTAYLAVRALIEFLRPIPSVALIPLAVLVFGVSLKTKLFLVVFASFWPILFQAIYGVQDVDPVAEDTARAFGFGGLQRLFIVTLPGAVPYIATGLRISSSVALILAVTAEFVVGAPGLGKTIGAAHSGGDYPLLYGLIMVAGVLGLVLNEAFQQVEGRLLHWHPSQRVAA
jgi:ABC-type nitrate/sulfonate/bicarbonate transport system permease component